MGVGGQGTPDPGGQKENRQKTNRARASARHAGGGTLEKAAEFARPDEEEGQRRQSVSGVDRKTALGTEKDHQGNSGEKDQELIAARGVDLFEKEGAKHGQQKERLDPQRGFEQEGVEVEVPPPVFRPGPPHIRLDSPLEVVPLGIDPLNEILRQRHREAAERPFPSVPHTEAVSSRGGDLLPIGAAGEEEGLEPIIPQPLAGPLKEVPDIDHQKTGGDQNAELPQLTADFEAPGGGGEQAVEQPENRKQGIEDQEGEFGQLGHPQRQAGRKGAGKVGGAQPSAKVHHRGDGKQPRGRVGADHRAVAEVKRGKTGQEKKNNFRRPAVQFPRQPGPQRHAEQHQRDTAQPPPKQKKAVILPVVLDKELSGVELIAGEI